MQESVEHMIGSEILCVPSRTTSLSTVEVRLLGLPLGLPLLLHHNLPVAQRDLQHHSLPQAPLLDLPIDQTLPRLILLVSHARTIRPGSQL